MVCFSLNLSDDLYNEQVCSGTDALPTPVQDLSDAPDIKLFRDIPNRVLLNYFLLQQYKGKLNVFMKQKLITMEWCNFAFSLLLQKSERNLTWNTNQRETEIEREIRTNCLSIARSDNSSVSLVYHDGDFLFS